MSVQHVEVDEIREYDRTVARLRQGLERRIEQSRIAARLDLPRDALIGVDIGNLANTDDLSAGRHELVEHRRQMWQRRQVAPVTGTHVILRAVTDERPRDDAADVVVVDQLAGYVAEFVEPLQPERLFVCRYLEYAIRRCINDRLSRPDVFVAELGDNRRAGCVAVAENAGQSGAIHELFDQLGWKRVGPVCEIAPVEQDRNAGDLPVAAGRVLAARKLLGETVGADDFATRVYAVRIRPRALATRLEQPQPGEIRQPQRPFI